MMANAVSLGRTSSGQIPEYPFSGNKNSSTSAVKELQEMRGVCTLARRRNIGHALSFLLATVPFSFRVTPYSLPVAIHCLPIRSILSFGH